MRKTLAVCLLIAAAACDQQKPTVKPPDTAASSAPSSAKVLARVNDAPITDYDVELRSKSPGGHGGAAAAAPESAVLETVIRDEIVYQRGVELGLDRDPTYRKKVEQMEASVTAFKRREMTELFFEREVNQKAEVSEKEARQYFDEHAKEINSELHVLQILITRDEAAARAAHDEIKRGASFEAVAKKRFPGLPENMKPWDLGYLKWSQIPEAWWSVIFTLKPGDVSDVIAAEKTRFWVLKLVDRRQLEGSSFEQVKPRIEAVLKRKKVEQRRAAVLEELRKNAKVVYSAPRPSGSAP